MEHISEYDLEPWNQKRKVLWRAIQLPGSGVSMASAWRDHSQLYKMLQNADQYATHIRKEEANCRRLKKETVRLRKLIKTFEETVQTLESMTLMYRLTYQ